MSVRIGLYDFFAYTIPGVFYLLIASYAAMAFGLLPLNWNAVSNLSLPVLIILTGTGYVVGILFTSIAQKWTRLFRTRKQSRIAFLEFTESHPWLNVKFESTDWDILLRALKESSEDAATDIEHLNVLAIMLRNISFGIGLLAGVFLLYFFTRSAHVGNVLISALLIAASVLAARTSATFSRWYFQAIFAAIAARGLKPTEWVSDKRLEGDAVH